MTTIRDKSLEPYFIGKDAYCYTAYEVITPQKKYLAKGSEGKNIKDISRSSAYSLLLSPLSSDC